MTDQEESLRGQLAEQVLANPVYQDAYRMLESEITEQWKQSRDAADRENLHRLLMALTKSRQVMEGVMRSGKLAAAELERKQTLMERIGLRRNAA